MCAGLSKPNLSSAEIKAITALKNNKRIILKPADKGGAIVVMDRSLYKQEGFRQLCNTKYYIPIEEPNWAQNVRNINKILFQMARDGFISDKQLDYLKAEIPINPRPFYLLPKVHKPRSKWPHPSMPEGRPICSDCASESYRICELIDHFIKPISNQHPAFLKDSYDFVERVRGKRVPIDSFICTADVTALYPNMCIERSLKVVEKAFKENPDPNRPDQAILKLLEISLKTNEFSFAGRFFKQICGTAMGKKYAPSLADMYMVEFDKKATGDYHLKPLLYCRFLDDIFFIWKFSLEELKIFEAYLNKLIPGIQITISAKHTNNQFLDTTVYKTDFGEESYALATTVYFKPTDTHQLLHSFSHHPTHTCKGILKSQLLRFKRLGCTKYLYDRAAHLVFSILVKRGYSRRLFRSLKNEIWFDKLNTKTTQRGSKMTLPLPLLPIVNFYDPISKAIMDLTRSEISKIPSLKDKHRIIRAFKIHTNLGKMLTKSLFCE